MINDHTPPKKKTHTRNQHNRDCALFEQILAGELGCAAEVVDRLPDVEVGGQLRSRLAPRPQQIPSGQHRLGQLAPPSKSARKGGYKDREIQQN